MVQELLDGLVNWVMNTLINIIMNILIKPAVTLAYNLVMSLTSFYFYQVSVTLLSVVDFVTDMFRMVAGLKEGLNIEGLTNFFTGQEYSTAPGGYTGDTNDLLIKVVTSKEVLTMFGSMLTVGLFLMIACTLMATIKQEFNMQKSNKKGEIINKLLRTSFNMIMIPVVCIIGMYMSNMFLALVDTATGGGDATISGRIFTAACGNAFYDEDDDAFQVPLTDPISCGLYGSLNGVTKLINEWVYKVFNDKIPFGSIFPFDERSRIYKGGASATTLLNAYEAGVKDDNVTNTSKTFRVYYNATQVSRDFNAVRINYILIYFSSIAIIKCLMQSTFGLIGRFYKATALFILLPGVLGISPLDDGSAYKSWKKEFSKQVIGAYGVIIAVNLYLEMMGVFSNIRLYYAPTNHDPAFFNASSVLASTMSTLMTDSYLADAMLKIVFIVVGALMLDKFAATISSLIGGENLASVGKGLMGEVGKTTSTAAKMGLTLGKAGATLSFMGASKLAGGISNKVKDFKSNQFMSKDDYIKQGLEKAGMGDKRKFINKGKKKNKSGNDKRGKRAQLYNDEVKRLTEQYAKDKSAHKKAVKSKKKAARKANLKRTGFKAWATVRTGFSLGASGMLAPGTRGYMKRELVDEAMKHYDSTGSAIWKDEEKKGAFSKKTLDSKQLGKEESGHNMRVGVKLGKNAIKSLMPGAKLFSETQDGIKSQRDKMKGNSDVDRDIIEAYEASLKYGDEEQAKKDFENLIEANTMKVVPPVLDSMEAGIRNAHAQINNDFRTLLKSIQFNQSQGWDIQRLLTDFINKYDLSGLAVGPNDSLAKIKSNIEAAIHTQFDLASVEKQIADIRNSSNSKNVIKGIQEMMRKYKNNPTMVAEMLKAVEQIQGGMKSNEKYKK